MHERTGIRRLYRDMVRDHRDITFESERERTINVLHSAKVRRSKIEQSRNDAIKPSKTEDKKRTPNKSKRKPPPSPKMVSAMNAYKSDTRHSQLTAKSSSERNARKSSRERKLENAR